jgi:hypothetical protein
MNPEPNERRRVRINESALTRTAQHRNTRRFRLPFHFESVKPAIKRSGNAK